MNARRPLGLPLLACVVATSMLRAVPGHAGGADPAADPVAPPAIAPAAPKAPDPFSGKTEPEALEVLRQLEAKLSLSQTATPAETDELTAAATASPHPSVRALAVAVCAWLDPPVVVASVIAATADVEPRVRAAAAQSLISLARRLDDEQKRRSITVALLLLDDDSDEVACAAAELVAALSPSAAADAMRTRGAAADDVRYTCFSRFGGLPLRAVTVPPLPSLDKPPEGNPTPAPHPAPAGPPDGTWLFVSTAATAGFLAGGIAPGAFLPSRDVLLYTESRTRLTHEEVALGSQLGAAALGGLLLGGGAWGLTQVARPLDLDEASAVAIGTGSLALVGASAPLAFGLRSGPGSAVTAAGFVVGAAASTAVAYSFKLDVNDEVLAASFMGIGALTAGTAVFMAVPVGLTNVGSALRVDFGLGITGIGAGAVGFAALAAGTVLDVRPSRSFLLLAGATLGASVGLAGGYLFTPASDVKSRIASGIGLGGELVGFWVAAFVPDDWLPRDSYRPAVGTAVSVDGSAHKVSLGIPVLVAFQGPRGTAALGATLVSGHF